MANKIWCSLFIMGTSLLLSVNLASAKVVETVNLELSGLIDMTMAERFEHEVTGVLVGNTYIEGSPVYNATKTTYWLETVPLVALSNVDNACQSNGFVVMPFSFSQQALPLTNLTSNLVQAYYIPKIEYEMTTTINQDPLRNYYKGAFFSAPAEGLTSMPSFLANMCFYPKNSYLSVPGGGKKTLRISLQPNQTIYTAPDLAPGKFSYSNSAYPLFVVMGARSSSTSFKVLVNGNFTVLRYCEVSNITNSRIEHTFVNETESIQDSSLTVKCNGSRQDTLHVTALAKETTYDSQEPTKLLLQPADNTTKSDTLPWVLGAISQIGKNSVLGCKDVGRSDLIHFDGREMDLKIQVEPNKPIPLNIKWALCRTPEVNPGNYHGKTELNFFVKS
ncbi:hypothetical protein [Providencia vermicola]|uniref:hypothetical protein n=1 Tax=Providencia vermicola TaxID=333965 RepID=UPI0022095D64|nr:hypothetical protein NFC79_06445 [Providencia stuartii]